MKQKRARKQWPLARVMREHRSAGAVWLALLDMQDEKGSPVLTPTRNTIAARAAIKKLDTVSAALTALEKAGWIDRVHVPTLNDGHRATLLRIILRRMHRKAGHTVAGAVCPEKRWKGRPRKTGHDFPKGKDGTVPSLSGDGHGTAGVAISNDGRPATPHFGRTAALEKQRMAEIRQRRLEAESNGASTP